MTRVTQIMNRLNSKGAKDGNPETHNLPDEDTMQEEDPDRVEDLVPRRKKRSAPGPDGGEGESMGLPPGKKPKEGKAGEDTKTKERPQATEAQEGEEEQRNPTARRDSTGGPPGEDPLIQEQDPVRGNDPVPRTAQGGGYRPLRRRDATFETRGGANTTGDGPRSG